jgi:hypothetical protein
MGKGLPITCASCFHLNTAVWKCDRKDTCGGPMVGRDFPDYEGVLNRDRFQERCLVCGGGALSHSMLIGTTRFGLCAEHVSIFQTLKSPTGHITDRIIPPPVILELPQ